jgi:hypothetical protein
MATEPDPPTYFALRELLAGDIRRGTIKHVTRSALIVRAWHYEVPEEESREWADRFLAELAAGSDKRNPASRRGL